MPSFVFLAAVSSLINQCVVVVVIIIIIIVVVVMTRDVHFLVHVVRVSVSRAPNICRLQDASSSLPSCSAHIHANDTVISVTLQENH
jgi:hypothetical protein